MSTYKPTSKVAFDIDGIILDTPAEMWKVFTQHFDIPWSIDAWKEYYIEKQLGIPQANLRPLYEPVLWRKDLPLVEGAAAGLRKFYSITKEPVLLITARRPQFVDSARESIAKELPDIPLEIISTSERDAKVHDKTGHHKTDYLVNHAVDFFVDDHPHSWDDYVKAGVVVGTLEWPWTKGPAEGMDKNQFVMFKDWEVLADFLHLGVEFMSLVKKIKEESVPI